MGLFSPKWKSQDYTKARHAVSDIHQKNDEETLRRIARTEKGMLPKVRLYAGMLLKDVPLLREVLASLTPEQLGDVDGFLYSSTNRQYGDPLLEAIDDVDLLDRMKKQLGSTSGHGEEIGRIKKRIRACLPDMTPVQMLLNGREDLLGINETNAAWKAVRAEDLAGRKLDMDLITTMGIYGRIDVAVEAAVRANDTGLVREALDLVNAASFQRNSYRCQAAMLLLKALYARGFCKEQIEAKRGTTIKYHYDEPGCMGHDDYAPELFTL